MTAPTLTRQDGAASSLAGWLDAAREAVESAAAAKTSGLGPQALGAAIAQLASLEASAAALRMSLSKQADEAGVADDAACTDAASWLAQLTGNTREAEAGGLRLARLLQEKYSCTASALSSGR